MERRFVSQGLVTISKIAFQYFLKICLIKIRSLGCLKEENGGTDGLRTRDLQLPIVSTSMFG